MKEKSSNIKSMLLFLILALLSLSFLQDKYDLINIKPLKGFYVKPTKMDFNLKNWFSGEYQTAQEKYLNGTFGLRGFFVRVNNQFAYTFFNKARANGVIIGKENYLYDLKYIKALYGEDFVGEESINERMQQLKFIQDTLTQLNKNLILLFCPGKASFYPEFIPDEYITEQKRTNYEVYIEQAKQLGLAHIDFRKYFLDNKNSSQYSLYPMYGIHWSYYGSCLAADSIINFIEKERNIDIPNLYWNDVKMAQPNGPDYDVAEAMNVLFRLKSPDMAYPNVKIESDSGKVKPSVLFVSDSFFWDMFNFGFTRAFSNSHLWYYNNEIFPDSYRSPLNTSQIILKDEIDKHDVIVLMATPPNLPNFGWGFIENVYSNFKGIKKRVMTEAEYADRLAYFCDRIKSDKKWMEDIKKKAKKANVTVEAMLMSNANWMVDQEMRDANMVREKPLF